MNYRFIITAFTNEKYFIQIFRKFLLIQTEGNVWNGYYKPLNAFGHFYFANFYKILLLNLNEKKFWFSKTFLFYIKNEIQPLNLSRNSFG